MPVQGGSAPSDEGGGLLGRLAFSAGACHHFQFLPNDGGVTLGPPEPGSRFLGDGDAGADAFDDRLSDAILFAGPKAMADREPCVRPAGGMARDLTWWASAGEDRMLEGGCPVRVNRYMPITSVNVD